MSATLENETSNQEKTDTQQRNNKPKKKYDPTDYYLKHAYIDCKDSVNSWCLARILERCDDDNTIRVNFDGWSHKWDEWFKFSSSKVAPFRKFSVGYSGQSKAAIRDWKFSLEELKQKIQKLQDYVSSDFATLDTPFYITQYLRGSEYVYVDCLLGHDYKNPKEELKLVFTYFQFFFKAYVKLLKLLPAHIPEYLEGIANYDAFLHSPKIALVHSLYEMSDAFNKILGSSERLWGEFRKYDSKEYDISICEAIEYSGKDIGTQWTADSEDDDIYIAKHKVYSELICQLVNLFGSLGGFDAWIAAFTYHSEETEPNAGGPVLPPFKMMMILLTNVSNIHAYLNKDLQERIAGEIKGAILRRLSFISDKEIKDLDRDVLVNFLYQTQHLLINYFPKNEVYMMTETAELDLSLRFLTCPYFEKRLRGINEIKELAEKIDEHEDYAKESRAFFTKNMTKALNAKMFIEWVNKNKIFELILGDSIHIEIIKRTHEIIKILAKYEKLPINLLDLIWNSCAGKHEAITIGIYNLIVEIAEILDPQGIEFLKQKINSIPDEEQNELTINLIKGFAQKTLPTSEIRGFDEKETKEVDEAEFHCVDTLWRLMLDDSKVSSVLSQAALNGLTETLKRRACQRLRRVYLFKCFEKIKKKDSVSQCLNLIHSLLNNTYHTQRFDSENSLGYILELLDTKFDLVELLVTEFEFFHKRIQEIFAKRNTDPQEEERNKVFFGKYPYSMNFNNRLVFLEYILMNPSYEIEFNLNQIERLWDLLDINSIWESDRDMFFSWISKNNEPRGYDGFSSVIATKLIPQFFSKILCNHRKFDFVNMSPKGFECFNTYFKIINEQRGNFKPLKGSKFLVYDLNFEGKDSLWSIFLNCKNQNTINKVVNLLVNCSLKLGPNLEREKKKVCEEFTNKCMNLLKEGSIKQNDRLISKSVFLLMVFFDCFEGKNVGDSSEPAERRPYTINITPTVILKPENIVKHISATSNQTIGDLRGLIAERFGFAKNEFKMSIKNSVIDADEDDTRLWKFPMGGPYIIQRVPVPKTGNNDFHPKHIMTQNAENIDLLFKLLSEDVQSVNSVWNLLTRLPINEKIKNSLYEVSDTWENLLEIKSKHLHRLLYCLQIIEDFLLGNEADKPNASDDILQNDNLPQFKDEAWMVKFEKTGGLKTLFTILHQSKTLEIKSTITIKSISIVLKIICAYFSKHNYQSIFGDKASQVELETVQEIIHLINNTCEHSLHPERQESNNNSAEYSTQTLIKVYNAHFQEFEQVPEVLYYESELITYAQTLLLKTVQRNPLVLPEIYRYSKLDSMLSNGLIESNNEHLKERLSVGILNLLVEFQSVDVKPAPHQFFLPILLQSTLKKALVNQDKSEVFFRMLTNIVNQINFAEVSFDVDKLLSELTAFIKERTPKEKTQKDIDIVLHGILQLMKGLFLRFPEKSQKYGQEERLVSELMQNGLFEIPTRANKKLIPGPKCKNQTSRSAALKLLVELAKGSPDNLKEIINYLAPIHKTANWRTKRWVDWHITQKSHEKSSTGYVGLKNLGCICYMNSTIQQLYMIPTFRKAVLAVEDKSLNTVAKDDNILYQLKCIFTALNESEKQAFNPKGFCHAFKDYDGNPTNVFEQMDADEFFNMFMDKLENQIKSTKYEHSIKQHFGGVVSNELICKGCPHYSEREESFLTVNLQVKNKKNIDQSLAAFIEGEMLEGDNAYHCAICDKKVNTLKRACLKKLPNHLIMVLKRFEFDYDSMTKVKVNDYFEFPNILNMEPYTQQGLRKAEKAKKEEGDQEKKEGEPEVHEYPPSYFEYKLSGVVIHLGFADSGHYYSLIQDRELNEVPEDQRWYEFNDNVVSSFDPKSLSSVAFGGEEKMKFYSGMDHSTEKIKNAYLLFYERIEHFNEDTAVKKEEKTASAEEAKEEREEGQAPKKEKVEEKIEEKVPPVARKLTSDSTLDSSKRGDESLEELKNIPQDFRQSLMEKNQKFHMHKNIFSREYFEFVEEIVTNTIYTPNFNSTASPNDTDLETIKFGILFLLTAIFRDKPRSNITRFLPFLKHQLSQNVPASLWLLDQFCNKKLKLEFFLDCPVSDMQRFAVGLVSVAYKTVFEHEGKGSPTSLFDVDPKTKLPLTVLGNFTNSVISIIFDAKENNRDYTEFFRLFSEMISCGHEVAEYLISKMVVGRLMDFFYQNASPFNDFFRDMSDVKYKEPAVCELGLPQEEKIRIRTAWEEFLLKRKNQQTSENHTAQKSYLWKTVNLLVHFCRIQHGAERCPWQFGTFDCTLHPKEMALLTPSAQFITRAISDGHTKIGYRNIAQLYSYLAYEDPKFTETLNKAIQYGIVEAGGYSMKSFTRCFLTVLTLQDSLAANRCNELCQELLNSMDENKKFYNEMDVLITFFIKLNERIPEARTWFHNHADSWEWVINWLLEYPTPPQLGMMHGNIRVNRKRNQMGMSDYKDVKEHKARTNIKLSKLRRLAQGTLEQNNGWDSDDDLADHNFALGDQVDAIVNGSERWMTAEVHDILEEMVHLLYHYDDEQQHLWISKDSERLAQHPSMQRRQDELMEEMERLEGSKNSDNENQGDHGEHHDGSFKGEDGTDNSSELSGNSEKNFDDLN